MAKKIDDRTVREISADELKRITGWDDGIVVSISEAEAIELIRFKLEGLIEAIDCDTPPNCPPFLDQLRTIIALAGKLSPIDGFEREDSAPKSGSVQ